MAKRMKPNGNGDAKRTTVITKSTFLRISKKISTAKQVLDDATTDHASAWEQFDQAGGNKAALKHALKLKKQDAAKTADFQFSFGVYADWLGLDAQGDVFDESAKTDGEASSPDEHHKEDEQPAAPAG